MAKSPTIISFERVSVARLGNHYVSAEAEEEQGNDIRNVRVSRKGPAGQHTRQAAITGLY